MHIETGELKEAGFTIALVHTQHHIIDRRGPRKALHFIFETCFL